MEIQNPFNCFMETIFKLSNDEHFHTKHVNSAYCEDEMRSSEVKSRDSLQNTIFQYKDDGYFSYLIYRFVILGKREPCGFIGGKRSLEVKKGETMNKLLKFNRQLAVPQTCVVSLQPKT